MEEKLSIKQLEDRITSARALINIGATYNHYKNKRYKVTGLAIIESTNEVGVIYEPLYAKNLTFIRPLASWLEDVSVDGRLVKRFTEL